MVKDKDKVKGALYGVAVGDALGAPAEMMDRDELVEKFGKLDTMLSGGWFDRDAGEPTDDTAMMLCVGEGIMADPENPVPEVGKRFIEWVESGPPNIGMTSSHAIATARYLMHTIYKGQPEEAWDEAGLQVAHENGHQSMGNGALMRTIPTALAYDDIDDMVDYTEQIATMTHHDSMSTRLCVEYVYLVHELVTGNEDEAMKHSDSVLDICRDIEEVPKGKVMETMLCAMKSWRKTDSFRAAVIDAVNRGGDADTIGAVTGGMAGARYGYSAIPEEWLAALPEDIKARLDALADWCAAR